MKITYVGNVSKDNIKTIRGENKISIGGSAIYSSFATKSVNKNINISVVSNTTEKDIEYIEYNNIQFEGRKIENETEFMIDEKNGTCIGKNYNDIYLENKTITDHLHVSFRKGIDINNIINNTKIKYKTLSVDVMIHSVKSIIPQIIKYESKINILFCNLQEYKIIREYVEKIPLVIITNNEYPIIIKEKGKLYIYNVKKCKNIVSDTGAGDSFIGGFLGEYLKNKNTEDAIKVGAEVSRLSLLSIGPIKSNSKIILNKEKIKKLPNNIIVIGNPCTGKTTFINILTKYFDVYSKIDDVKPLQEVFYMDDTIRKNADILTDSKFNKNIIYSKDIIEEYKISYPKINYYTKPSKNKKGHDIIRPILWNKIIEYAIMDNNSKNKIIEFSRGKDEQYEKEYGEDVYQKNIKEIFKYLVNKDDTIIINIKSPYNTRIERNKKRAKRGGHYVSDNTMEKVYRKDYFNSEKYGKFSAFNIDSEKILVYNLNNNQRNKNHIEEYIAQKIKNMVKIYNEFKEKENGFKESTKRNISK